MPRPVAVASIIMFFVTSSDSGSTVIDIITAGGNPDPPASQRLFWAILEGVVATARITGIRIRLHQGRSVWPSSIPDDLPVLPPGTTLSGCSSLLWWDVR